MFLVVSFLPFSRGTNRVCENFEKNCRPGRLQSESHVRQDLGKPIEALTSLKFSLPTLATLLCKMRSTSLLRQAAVQATSPDAYAKSLAYATDLVRRTDHEAIYASHFYPGDVRPAYLALRALNAELAGLPDQVSNQLVGRMRFQWWKDAIKGLYDVSPLR